MSNKMKNISFIPPMPYSPLFQYDTNNLYFDKLEKLFSWMTAVIDSNKMNQTNYHCGLYNYIGVLFCKITALNTWNSIQGNNHYVKRNLQIYTSFEDTYFDNQTANDDMKEIMRTAKVTKLIAEYEGLAYSSIEKAIDYQADMILLAEKGKSMDTISKYAEKRAMENNLKCLYIHPNTFDITDEQNILSQETANRPMYKSIFDKMYQKL